MSVVMQHQSSSKPELEFTEAAIKHITSYLEKDPQQKGVRLSVKKTGCSGLSYVVDYINAPQPDDFISALNDQYVVCVDKSSYPFLKNLKIDFYPCNAAAPLTISVSSVVMAA